MENGGFLQGLYNSATACGRIEKNDLPERLETIPWRHNGRPSRKAKNPQRQGFGTLK